MKKYLVLLLLILALLVNTLSISAQNIREEAFEDTFNKTYTDVLYNEILKKVDIGLESYLAGESTKREITKADKWIPLETIDGERYAFLVPLAEADKTVGYAVIGAIDGNYRMLELTLDASKLTDKISKLYKNHTIAYKFPSGFIVNNKEKYYLLDYDLNEVDITNSKKNYNTELNNQLKQEAMEKLIDPSYDMKVIDPNIDSIYLSNHSNFVPAGGSNNHGGNQWWLDDTPPGYRSEFWASRACGPTAVANASYHMAKHKTGMSNLYYMSGISKNQFRTFMNDVYEYVSPTYAGITTISDISTKFENYATSRNTSLSRVTNTASWSIFNISSYIKQGLFIDSPILMLTWNTPNNDLDYHWVTITGYYHNRLSNDRTVTVANNGNKQIHDLQAWYDDGSFYQGLIYFD